MWAGRSLRSLKLRAAGTTALPGYVTVPLDQHDARPPRASTSWSPSGSTRRVRDYPLAIEYPRTAWMSGATGEKGQSFMSRDGMTWTDTTSVYRRSNVCLKAFAQ